MSLTTLLLILGAMTLAAFYLGRRRALARAGGVGSLRRLSSLPKFYGYYAALWCLIPALGLLLLWLMLSDAIVTAELVRALPDDLRSLPESRLSLVLNDIRNLAGGQYADPSRSAELAVAVEHYLALRAASRNILSATLIAVALASFAFAWSRVAPAFRARARVESIVRGGLVVASTLAIFTTAGILLSVVFEAWRFFQQVPVTEFLFGLSWSPQTAIRADQVGSSGAFGAVPLFAGTLLISGIALLVAVPLGLMTAIYLSEYALPSTRRTVKPILEAVAASDVIDAVIVQHEVSAYMPAFIEETADVIPSVRDASGKPFIVTMPEPTTSSDTMHIEETRRRYREWYLRRGVPVFDTLERAVSALGKIIRYNEWVAARKH